MPGKRELPGRKRRIPAALILFALFLLWIPLELYLSNNAPRTEAVTVRLPRLPAAFDGARILHLSDMHEKVFGKDNETLLRMAEKASPDIIAVTGDFIQSPEGLAYAENLLPRLTAVAPVYYVTGNHEWANDNNRTHLIQRLKAIVEGCGGVWLDSSFTIWERGGEPVVLAGLCDPNGPRAEPDAGELRRQIDAAAGGGLFTILLSHRHDRISVYAAAGFDVVLAGHAHGGVVRLPFTDGLIGPDRDWFPKGTSGVLAAGDTRVVVSRGVGDTYFPRFLNRPQVLVVTLRRGG
ncbi:MAG: metallophosphoesterase [Oscillospiraceae bacterium]|jgi:predicted MPP superfamily phosphohydrolase|nr:metallophosphoesterase [Oscillospiraceae bacterium]